ncbi:MAG: RidA family protein [Candidatus Nanopelagicales bacterium]
MTDPAGVTRYPSGGPWEDVVGYSRAVVAGPLVLVAGCTATVDGVVAHAGDPYAQALAAFGVALDAVGRAGGTVADVVQTRMYVFGIEHRDAVGRAHRELFGHVRPAATMVGVAELVDPAMLVEVEVVAYLPSAAS